MIYQYAFNISDIASIRDVRNLLDLISDERRERIRRFRFDKDKLHSLFAEVLLRYALWERYGIRDFVMERNEYGKPYLVNHNEVFFSLSHSGDWVLCGLGDQNLGIDVEQIEDIEQSITYDYFAKEDIVYLNTFHETERTDAFYTIWTLKESYTKNVGEGMSIPLDSFTFMFDYNRINIYIHGKRDDRFWFQTRNLDARHKMSLCVTGEGDTETNDDLSILTLQDILPWENAIG